MPEAETNGDIAYASIGEMPLHTIGRFLRGNATMLRIIGGAVYGRFEGAHLGSSRLVQRVNLPDHRNGGSSTCSCLLTLDQNGQPTDNFFEVIGGFSLEPLT